jgi:hypothetical protein
MKIFGKKGAPITRAGRIIDETQRESAKKPQTTDEVAARRKKSGGKK